MEERRKSDTKKDLDEEIRKAAWYGPNNGKIKAGDVNFVKKTASGGEAPERRKEGQEHLKSRLAQVKASSSKYVPVSHTLQNKDWTYGQGHNMAHHGQGKPYGAKSTDEDAGPKNAGNQYDEDAPKTDANWNRKLQVPR